MIVEQSRVYSISSHYLVNVKITSTRLPQRLLKSSPKGKHNLLKENKRSQLVYIYREQFPVTQFWDRWICLQSNRWMNTDLIMVNHAYVIFFAGVGRTYLHKKSCIFLGRQTIDILWVANLQDTLIYSIWNSFSLGQGEENLLHMSSVSVNTEDYNYVLMLIQLLQISCCKSTLWKCEWQYKSF